MHREYVDTSRGLVLTSDTATAAARKKTEQRRAEKVAAAEKAAAKVRSEEQAVLRAQHARHVNRACLARMPINVFREQVRPLSVPRRTQTVSAAAKRSAVEAMLDLSSNLKV